MKANIIILSFLLIACGPDKKKQTVQDSDAASVPVTYASGFTIADHGPYKMVTVKKPWPKAGRSYKYLLLEEDFTVPPNVSYDQKVKVPVKKIVVTSTTHIPSLEALGVGSSLVGFPGLDYISSQSTRKRIERGKVRELGQNEALNTETLLELRPDLVVAFAVDGSNSSLSTIRRSGIPVVYNSDWTEPTPLGKAEWIKFFGAFYGKTEKAVELFEKVEKEYLTAKNLAASAKEKPSVLAGAMYKDQWFLPAGDSWQAQFFEDAHSNYLFSETEGTGSLSLSIEAVLAEALNARYWIGPAQFQSYQQLRTASPHYSRFEAFKKENVFTFSSVRGEGGGVLFYELAPNRPDLVLKDLISILHPNLLRNYETTFFKPLK